MDNIEIYEKIDLSDCPECGGAALLEEENESFYVTCMECGGHSVNVSYRADGNKMAAAEKTAALWNSGKIISSSPGE